MTRALPLDVAVRLTHAAVQVIADTAEVDVLHIKGYALDASLRPLRGDPSLREDAEARSSVDADVWVRPKHVSSIVSALRQSGWTVAYHFRDGSPFRHAMTRVHKNYAPLDLHRSFPGKPAGSDDSFQVLWERRQCAEIAGVVCTVPDLAAQRMLVVLHAVRSGRLPDIGPVYDAAPRDQREAVSQLASCLNADVALAAGTGRLEEYRDRREYRLWKAILDGEPSQARMWIARVSAEPTLRERAVTGLDLLRPKPDRLKAALGRRPTTADKVRDVGRTAKLGFDELRFLLDRYWGARS